MESAMSDDLYFLRFEHKPLTPQQWEHLQRSVVRRATENRAQIARGTFAAILAALRWAAEGGRHVARMLGRRAAAAASGRWRCYTTWRARRRAVQELRSLDDHVLKDLGLHRSGIEAAVYGLDSSRVAEGSVAAASRHTPQVRRPGARKADTQQSIVKSAA
jgi:uncharacterized protein YjiS (DUF1127 family)